MTTGLGAILNLLSPMDLSYIYDLFDTEEEQKDMLTLAKQELEINLEELIRAVASQEPKQIKHFAHKLTSKILVLSIPALEACKYVEKHATEPESELFQEKYHLLKMYCLIRLGQIQE